MLEIIVLLVIVGIILYIFEYSVNVAVNKRLKEDIDNLETPNSLIDTLWYIPGLNDNKPILKIDSIEHNFVSCSYLDEENKNKTHYQNLDQFKKCFSRYEK